MPSIDASDEVETPEGELHTGDESDRADVDRGHRTCWDDLDNTPTWRGKYRYFFPAILFMGLVVGSQVRW